MQQAKVSLTPSLIELLNNHKLYGFKDKSAMVRAALQQFQEELALKELEESADLYAELYEEDQELQELTEAAVFPKLTPTTQTISRHIHSYTEAKNHEI